MSTTNQEPEEDSVKKKEMPSDSDVEADVFVGDDKPVPNGNVE